MVDLGLELQPGHRLVPLAERPDLIDPSDRFNGSVWPRFMLESEIANGLFGRCFRDWPEIQFVQLDAAGEIVSTNNCMCGPYVVRGATSPIEIDRERDEAVDHDQNVWMVHDLG